METEIAIDCGISSKRITSWLDEELGLPRTHLDATPDSFAWLYSADASQCRIMVEALEPRQLGAIKLERTFLTARGGKRAVDALQKQFTLRFASAGG